MKIFVSLAIIFCLFHLKLNGSSFEGVQVTEEDEEIEAYFRNDTLNSEFCCEREYTADWAQEMSEQESQDIVKKVLYSQSKKPKPARRRLSPAGSGQR